MIVAFLLALGGLTFAAIFIAGNQLQFAAPSAVIGAAGLATLGWLVAAYNQRVLSRKQHTLNLLMQWRHSELYKKNADAILAECPQGKSLTARQAGICIGTETPLTQGEKALPGAGNYVLNYWEFVCASVIVKDLDAELIRRTVRPHIVGCHHKFALKIDHDLNKSPLTFHHLRRLALEWQTPAERERLAAIRAEAASLKP